MKKTKEVNFLTKTSPGIEAPAPKCPSPAVQWQDSSVKRVLHAVCPPTESSIHLAIAKGAKENGKEISKTNLYDDSFLLTMPN